jgi:cell division protein FtsB
MFEKIKNYKKDPFLSQFQDVRTWGLVVFGIVAVLVTWSGIKSVQTNYDLQKQISELEQRNTVQKLENTNLELRNQYYNTDQFLELAARRQFGMAAPGETELLVPKRVALARTVDLPKLSNKTVGETALNKPKYQQNFEAWVNFFLHRQNQTD